MHSRIEMTEVPELQFPETGCVGVKDVRGFIGMNYTPLQDHSCRLNTR